MNAAKKTGMTRTSARKVPTIKPRNPVLVPALGRKAGKHAPDPKGQRRSANRKAEVEGEVALSKRPRRDD